VSRQSLPDYLLCSILIQMLSETASRDAKVAPKKKLHNGSDKRAKNQDAEWNVGRSYFFNGSYEL
jgi:hypothetical protein